MSDSPTDFYHQKTDAELQFLVEHPDYYQPALVEMARQELRRRGVGPRQPVTPAPPALVPAHHSVTEAALPAATEYRPAPEAAPAPTGPLVLGIAVALALGLGGFYYVRQKNAPAIADSPAMPVRKKAPPRLIEVPTSAIPNYDVAGFVEQQLERVPAAERAAAARADGAALRQYRELAKRFWAAEAQTEYLLDQARTGQAGPMFAEQTLVARATWSDWNKAVVYRYKFGPVMQRHFGLMRDVASSQQHLLEMYPDLLPNRDFASDKEVTARAADVQHWMQGLLPVSPITGQAYKAPTLTIRL